MGRNDHYFVNRNERKEKAIKWTRKIGLDEAEAINACYLQTKTYSDYPDVTGSFTPELILEETDSVSSLFNHKNDGSICVLNFASFRNPGGMFIEGSSAQEECLCHASFLYNVLTKCSSYYEWNLKNINRGLYKNRALLSPDVKFFRDDETLLSDVLTCASPNRSSLVKYGDEYAKRFTEEENLVALEERIKFVCSILNENQYDTVILGAFGCGVFAQKPEVVSTLFKKYLTNFQKPVKAVFAIPGGENYDSFKKQLG